MTGTCVCGCRRTLIDGYAHTDCTEQARGRLKEISELVEPARAVMYRQTAAHGGGHSTPGPRDLLDYGAGARLDAVQNALTGWVEDLDYNHTWKPTEGERIPQAAAWLTERLEVIRHVRQADDILREIFDCLMTMRSIVATPAGRVYLGKCGAVHASPDPLDDQTEPFVSDPCDGDVYGKPDRNAAYCNACGAAYDQAERRRQVAKLVQGGCYRASQLEHAYGLSAATVRKWAERELIVARDRDGQGRPLYRLDEVLAVAASEQQRRDAARQKREQRRGEVVTVTPG